MLVNGKPAALNPSVLLNQLASLNSNFPEYSGVKAPYFPPNDVVKLFSQGQQFLQQGNTKMALQQFQAAENRCPKNQPNNQCLGAIYSNIASIQQVNGDYKNAEINFNKSINEFADDKNYYGVESNYKAIANIHKANGTLEQYEKENQALLNNSLQNNDQQQELKARFALGGMNRVQGKHDNALEHYAKAYDLQQGKVDYEAVRVEQHEVGFSDKKIGTDNIQQCVAVILYDPITKKTALAHVDRFTDTKSLGDVIANFPPGAKLEARLVGGRDRSTIGKAVSDDNISRVLGELKNHSTVDIKSADIGDKGAPSGIVFDPQTGKLEHAVPGKHHETTDERKLLHGLKPPLNFAFDLTKSSEMKGPTLTPQDKELLVQRYLATPKILNGPSSETWNANLVYDPLAKTVEKIRKTNPEIIESAIGKHLESKLGPNINVAQKKSLLNEAKAGLSDPKNSIFKIDQLVERRINETLRPNPPTPVIRTTDPVRENVTNTAAISKEPKDKNTWQTFKERVTAVIEIIKSTVQQTVQNVFEEAKQFVNNIISVKKQEEKNQTPVVHKQEQSKSQTPVVHETKSKPPPLPPKPKMDENQKKDFEKLKAALTKPSPHPLKPKLPEKQEGHNKKFEATKKPQQTHSR